MELNEIEQAVLKDLCEHFPVNAIATDEYLTRLVKNISDGKISGLEIAACPKLVDISHMVQAGGIYALPQEAAVAISLLYGTYRTHEDAAKIILLNRVLDRNTVFHANISDAMKVALLEEEYAIHLGLYKPDTY